MSKILEEYEKIKEMRKEIIRADFPLFPEESKYKTRKSLKNTRTKITETAITIISKNKKREFKDAELGKSMGKEADVKYLDEAMSKRFVCDGATLICKHLKFAERLILRVTDKGARLQGGNPIATEDDVLPENFEFQYSPIFTNDNFGNSNGVITEKTKGLCDVTGNVCVIQNAYWTKMATSILNNGKAMIFDTSELYCTVDEASPITVEYNGQDFSELEGRWNSLTRTHKKNPVLYNFLKSALIIYFSGDLSRAEDLGNSIVSYDSDEEVAVYSEIGYAGPSLGMYENIKDFGVPVIEGLIETGKELRKEVKPYHPTGRSRSIDRNAWKKTDKNMTYDEYKKKKAVEIYKKNRNANLKNIGKEMRKNLLLVAVEKGVDKVMVDYNSLIPTEARYNQSIDYFNKVYYIEDYTKE